MGSLCPDEDGLKEWRLFLKNEDVKRREQREAQLLNSPAAQRRESWDGPAITAALISINQSGMRVLRCGAITTKKLPLYIQTVSIYL